jgi:hypothetical protein
MSFGISCDELTHKFAERTPEKRPQDPPCETKHFWKVNVIGSVPMLSGPESLRVGAVDDDASEERITQMAHNSRSAELECTHEPVARPEISETRSPRA